MVITYKGYVAQISMEGDTLLGTVDNARSMLCFEGNTVPELREAFEGTVEEYLRVCEEEGIEPDKGYSGSFLARIGWELHKEMATAAAEAGQSMNAWLIDAIREKLTKDGSQASSHHRRPKLKRKTG